MKLYEVNGRIAELMDRLEPDPETGEITGDVDAVIAEIDGLQMERMDRIRLVSGGIFLCGAYGHHTFGGFDHQLDVFRISDLMQRRLVDADPVLFEIDGDDAHDRLVRHCRCLLPLLVRTVFAGYPQYP